MQDRLKEYIDQNKGEFDIYQPNENVWEGIDQHLQKVKKRKFYQQPLAIAATILLLIACGLLVYKVNRHPIETERTVQVQPPISGAELYFTTIVQMKDAQLAQYCSSQPALCHDFEKDIEALNTAYDQLKKEYTTAADKKAILQAMTANLHMQVLLINQQLQIMETVNRKQSNITII